MSEHTAYYQIGSGDVWGCAVDREQLLQIQSIWCCESCYRIRVPDVAIDVQVEYRPEMKINGPLNFIYFLGLVWKPFLDLFDPMAVQRDLRLGRVFGPDGSLYEDWLTFRGRCEVIVRGTKHVQYRICEKCGRVIYSAMGKRYLFPAPPCGAELFAAGGSRLVIPESAFARLDLGKWRKKVYIERLPVPETPPDGLGLLTGTMT